QAARGQLIRVDPDTHGVVLLTEQDHVADAVHAGQFVLEVNRGVIGQVQVVAAAVGRIDADDQQDVRRPLAGGDARLLDDVRQRRDRQVDTVLQQHLRGIEVYPRLGGDG